MPEKVSAAVNSSQEMYPEATESPRTSNLSATPTKSSPEKVKLSAPSALDDLCPTTSASPSPPASNTESPVELKDDSTLYHCPMMSCETKESFRGIEKHLEIDHPDLFVLYKRDLQAQYNHSVVRCPICEFHFASASEYEAHIPEQCAVFAKKTISPAMISYFKSQCSDNLREVEENEEKPECTFSCPIISCSEGFDSLGLLCWHMETSHPKKNAHFRRNIPCIQFIGPRCDDCGFAFPKPSEWSHPCDSLKQIAFDSQEEKEEAIADIHGDESTPHSLGNHLGIKEENDVAIRCDDCGENFFSEEDVYCHKWRDHCEVNPALSAAKMFEEGVRNVENSVEHLTENLPSSSFTPATADIHSRFSLAGVQEEWARGPTQQSRPDLSYRCPIKSCGKAFSKLGGIFKHLVPAHGYAGVLFRMQHKVPGLMMICETCSWNYADKNAIYKHRHLNTCVSNIRITKEQQEAYENDPNKRPLEEIMDEIDFNVLESVTGENYKPPPGTRKRVTPSHLMTLPADADTTQYIHDNIASDRSPSPAVADADTGTSTNAFQQLGVDFDQLTPETAATLLQLITHSLSTGATLPSVNDISPEKSLSTGNSENLRNTNICPAWGCKRKFTAFTHGGKSNISSLWIHMQNAHRNAFVVFRRMKRRGFDRYCDKCQFWLKGAEWYNHKNNRRYQTEGARPEGTYCDVYQKLAEGMEKHENPLFLVDIKMCIENYDCIVDNAAELIAQQSIMEDPSTEITEITDPDEFADVDSSPVHAIAEFNSSRTESPLPMPVSITGNGQTNMVCPIKSCRKQVVKPETQSHACWKNLFTHIKANHKNAYVLFRRLERENTKKRCNDCLFWFVNYRDYGAHNQRTGTSRDGGPRISYCQQYQRMALHDCKVKSIHELPSYEQLDFRVLEDVYKCKIPFDMDETSSSPAVDSPLNPELSIVEDDVENINTDNASSTVVAPFGKDLMETEVNPSHKPHEGQYLCPVRNCCQLIKTMKGVLGHMRIKHKREYIIFRRTKMALAHRKCEKCQFWFTSAKTYHQHKSQLPHQLPGENKGSECDAYIRIAGTFTPYELADHSNFVTALFEYYVTSTYQDKPHSRRKTNESYLDKITAALSTTFSPSPVSGLSGLSGLSLLEGFGNGLGNDLQNGSSPVPTKTEKEPDPETIIECPINDCPIQLKYQNLDYHISRRHQECFWHFKRSEFEAFKFRCEGCKFGYFSEKYFNKDHGDCSNNSEEKHRENMAPIDFEKGRDRWTRHLKIVDCPVNTMLNGEQKSPLQPLRGKSQDVANLSSKQDELERYDSISDVKAHCPDKNCIYVAPLRTLTTHASEKHPKLNVQFRTSKSDYFDQRCDACGFFFYSRSAIYNHKSTKKCEYYASERIKYDKWCEEVGPQGKVMIQEQIRESIKFNHGIKRKSAQDYLGDMKRSKFELDQDLTSTVDESGNPPEPRDCPYCLSKCLAGTFTGLCAHIRGSHPDRYIEFRTNRWPTTTHICKRCKFGTELPIEAWRRQHTSKICNDNIASFKKYDTSRLTIEEPTRGDENPCPVCNQETLGVKGLVTHMRFSHPDQYLKWRIVPNPVMGFQCSICGFCYSTDNELHNHQRKDGACKRNIDQLTYGLESTSSKNNTPSSTPKQTPKSLGSSTPIQIQKPLSPALNNSNGSTSSPDKSSQQSQSAEETSEELLTSPVSAKDSKSPAEYHCKICQNGVSFPTFGLLNVHMKNDHERHYIHFRITKTDQISIRCSICQFCFPAQNHYERHLNKNTSKVWKMMPMILTEIKENRY
ncbi:Oidioi.mRNA.OKI2018_I69.chr1.g2526.t1.cds [Oikopleura dioica]|uniref:Oidioi.mRNA.OKI2018_I69.chr1.g2526.t1.cds n=1 Tax=Oikopleura dioica TaxID=34765 RepID=A0ABN7SRC4_OIKDI|nr:Oidioi.mRNA.OKI2018_I69.chr1.g2526.t1.cds [Oikopleura dioica]